MSELPWNPYPQQDWRQLGGQPPYQGDPYRTTGEEPSDPEPPDGRGPPPGRRNRHMLRNILGGIGILAVAGLVVSALSSKGTGPPASAPRTSASAATAQPTASRASVAVAQPTGPGKVGSYFDVQDGGGNTYQVTLVKVIDPGESADQFVTLPHGSLLVGIVFRITALTGSPQGEDADNDCTITGTDGRVYAADFDSIVGYTNFEVGVVHVTPGGTVTGAVTFQLPQYIKVVAVRWAASDGLGSPVMWDVES